MPSILIANLGNRNLKYKGQFLDKDNFRELTRQLWENYEAEREHLDPVLLNEHLDENDVARIFLITTDQADPRYRAGDTVHEGAILQRLFVEDFKTWPVELLHYQGNPTIEAEIYPQLKPELLVIANQYPEHSILFLDAGGTPQLKNAVREYLRYAAGPARFRAVYTTPQDERREIDQTYHQRYQLLRAAREFVLRYDYASALQVLKELPSTARVGENLIALLRVAAARMRFDYAAAVQAGAQVAVDHLPTVFVDYLRKQPIPGLMDFPEDLPDDLPRFDVQEIASLCQLYLLLLKNYTLGIPTYYRLCEELGQNIAEDRALPQRLNLSDSRQAAGWVNQYAAIAQSYVGLRAEFGLPFLLAYAAENTRNDELQPVVREMHATISILNNRGAHSGLNKLRNRCFLAHQNQAVTAQAIEAECQGFLGTNGRAARIFQLLGLPERNVYDQMNDEILALFQQE